MRAPPYPILETALDPCACDCAITSGIIVHSLGFGERLTTPPPGFVIVWAPLETVLLLDNAGIAKMPFVCIAPFPGMRSCYDAMLIIGRMNDIVIFCTK